MAKKPINLATSAFGSILSSSSIMLVGVLTGVITARALGTEGRGLIAMVVTWTGLVIALTQLPISEAMVVSEDEGSESHLLAAGMSLSLSVAIVIMGPAIWILHANFSNVLMLPVESAVAYAVVMILAAATAICFRGFFQRQANFTKLFFYSNFQPAVYLLFLVVIFFVLDVRDVGCFLSALTVSMLVTGLLRLFLERRYVGLCFEISPIISLAKSSLLLHGSKVSQYFAEQGDRLLVVWLLPAEQIGIFFVAATFASIFPGLFTTAIRLLALPALASIDTANRTSHAIHILSVTGISGVFGFLVTAGSSMFFVPLLFGTEFAEAIPLSILLAATTALSSIRVSLLEVQKSYSVSISLVYSSFVLVCTIASIALGLFPYIGVMAIVAARGMGEVTTLLFLSWQLRHIDPNISLRDWLIPNKRVLATVFSQANTVVRKILRR